MKEYFCKNCHTVFMSALPRCCGEVEEFLPEKHAASLVSSSNSWIAVWRKWENNPLLEQVGQELANNGSYGAATCLNEFIERLVSAQQSVHPTGLNVAQKEEVRQMIQSALDTGSA